MYRRPARRFDHHETGFGRDADMPAGRAESSLAVSGGDTGDARTMRSVVRINANHAQWLRAPQLIVDRSLRVDRSIGLRRAKADGRIAKDRGRRFAKPRIRFHVLRPQ